MTSIDQEFETYSNKARNLPFQPSNDELSNIYGLFKQATIGDNDTDKPGFLDLKGRAKWEAWTSKKGISKVDAKKKYVEYIKQLLQSH